MCAALSQTQVVQSGWIVDSCCGGAGNDFVEKCRDREKKPYMYTFQGTQSVDATKKLGNAQKRHGDCKQCTRWLHIKLPLGWPSEYTGCFRECADWSAVSKQS